MVNSLHCHGCLSTSEELLFPANILVDIYYSLIASKGFKKDENTGSLMFCSDCCKKLYEVHEFQGFCQRSAQFLHSSGCWKMYSEQNVKFNKVMKELIEENVKKEEDALGDSFYADDFDQDLSDDADPMKIEPMVKVEEKEIDLKAVEHTTEAPKTVKKARVIVKARPSVTDSVQKRKKKEKSQRNKNLDIFCPFCKIAYSNHRSIDGEIISFKQHIIMEHAIANENGSFTCKICQGKVGSSETLSTHFRWNHMVENSNDLKCHYCDNTYRNRITLKTHIRSYHETERVTYTCDLCNKVFKQKGNIISHMKRHVKRYECKSCRASFHEKEEYRNHMKTCTEMPMCHICGLKLQTKSSLQNHILGQHLPPPPCEICGKEFPRKQDLDHHKVIEHTEKTFVCDLCAKKFFTQNGLNSHIRFTHLQEKNEYAKKKFWCEVCQKYELRQVMNDHRLKAMYGRRFKCEECGMAFFHSQRLKKHMYSHTKLRPFNCKICEAGYYHKSYLKAHYQRVHGSEYLGAIRR